ncbi:septum formation family protein [Paenarthrobacter sp. NPDC018779]|uniref:septum formation family protein n=1 Tax=Paenarthrobacter sp. NPDC018779 TaxID=3364375 RepID=UPI0037C9D582
MSQDNTPPRDGSSHEPGEEQVPPASKVPPEPQQPNQPPVPPQPLSPPHSYPPPGGYPQQGQPPQQGTFGQPVYPNLPSGPNQPSGPGQPPYAGQEPTYQQEPEHPDAVKRQRLVIGGIVLGVLVLIGVVIWVLLSLLGTRPEAVAPSPSPTATLGPLPRDTDSRDFQVGDCFAEFDPNATKAKAVACDTEHTAQLGAIHTYAQDDSFPGTNALRDKGREVCKSIKFNDAVDNYTNLLQQNVYPSQSSWDRGDRRVDCFIVVNTGSTLKEDLLRK